MSLFKSFSKVISQATLNSQTKTYILTQRFGIQNPAFYYLNESAPSGDIFQLSLVSYHLARKNEVNRRLLQQLEEKSSAQPASELAEYRESLTREADEGNRLVSQHVDKLESLFNSGITNLPINHAIKALYAFEATNKSNIPLYEKFLFPVIKEKLAYASLHNLIELTSLLSSVKYFEDKALWEGILKQLGQKFERPGPEYVKYSGWEINEYENDEKGVVRPKHDTEAERHFNDMIESGKIFGTLKHEVRKAWDSIQSKVLYRFLFRERTLTGTADDFPEILDRERLRTGLEAARNAGINVEDVIGRLKIE